MNPLVIRVGGYQKPASIHNRAAARFGEIVTRALGGKVAFELIGDVLALGRGSGDLLPMVAAGELEGCYISTVRFTKWVADFKLLELPFVVKDRPSIIAALNGRLGDHLKRRALEATPYRILGFWDNGFRHFTNRVRPIRMPADCRDLRIRTQMSELHVEAFRTLGFAPVPADVKEFVAEIAGDRFEAQDNPLTNIYNFGVHNFHRYITLSGHFWGASAFAFKDSVYRSWPVDVRAVIDDAAREATRYQHELAAAEDAAMLEKLAACDNEVVELTAEGHAAFAQALAPMLDKYRRELGPSLFSLLDA